MWPRAASAVSRSRTKTPRSGASAPGENCETRRMRTRAFLRACASAIRLLRGLVLLRVEHVREAVHARVARRKRPEPVSLLDRREDRRRVVLRVIDDLVPAEERR